MGQRWWHGTIQAGAVWWFIAIEMGEHSRLEFVTGEGATVAVVTTAEADIRPMGREEILHVRALVPA